MNWSYGVTTCPQRLDKLLPQTIASLAAAGFDSPRLFVDGSESAEAWKRFGLPITIRFPTIRTYCNWALALAELYLREPLADRYAIFQDDCITYRNLRSYLEACEYPVKGYWNLYTWPENQHLFVRHGGKEGWIEANQRGLGAVGLVFNREAVMTLLSHRYMLERPQNLLRGWRSLDGGIVTAMNNVGWKEWVHNPSLLQHIGRDSTMGRKTSRLANSFRGEEFDAMSLVGEACP